MRCHTRGVRAGSGWGCGGGAARDACRHVDDLLVWVHLSQDYRDKDTAVRSGCVHLVSALLPLWGLGGLPDHGLQAQHVPVLSHRDIKGRLI